MKILSPVSSVSETEALINAGAQELYCGLHPTAWKDKYGKANWVNRRGQETANIRSLNDLQSLTKIARRKNVPVFLTLNQPFYPPEQYPDLIELAREVTVNCNISALIISDPGLIMAVKDSLPDTLVHVSSLAAVLNSPAALFFQTIGASRIIFPRYMPIDDIRQIIEVVGHKMEYEVFILNDGCVFEEGYCHVSHALGGAFCHGPWNYRLIKKSDKDNFTARETFDEHMNDYKRWLWFVRNCNGGTDPGGYPLGMCGLCDIPAFNELGVKSLKIVGRESSLPKKTASVVLVKKVTDLLKTGLPRTKIIQMAQRIRGAWRLCNSGYMCYYR